ncbi:MAG: response regulator [Candidatus Angelobacter sp.]
MQLKDATVLIVDDEPVLCEIKSAWLTRLVGRVLVANNGAEALEVLAANPVDLVITDIRMPVMDGVTLLKKITASGKPQPRVIFITGFSDFDPRDAYDLGADAILEKPMERDGLLQVVKRSLMTRHELWRTPVDVMPAAVLHSSFPSLAIALQEQKIAFGRGGFCIAVSQDLHEGPIGILLEFHEDRSVLQGQGMVRWISPAEGLAGVELLYVAPASYEWMAELAEHNETTAYIPRSPSARQSLSAKTA